MSSPRLFAMDVTRKRFDLQDNSGDLMYGYFTED